MSLRRFKSASWRAFLSALIDRFAKKYAPPPAEEDPISKRSCPILGDHTNYESSPSNPGNNSVKLRK